MARGWTPCTGGEELAVRVQPQPAAQPDRGSNVRRSAQPRNRVAWVQRRFRRHLNGKRVICLDIPDDYACMDPALMALPTKRMARFV